MITLVISKAVTQIETLRRPETGPIATLSIEARERHERMEQVHPG